MLDKVLSVDTGTDLGLLKLTVLIPKLVELRGRI